MTRAARILCVVGCALLLITALFHGTGFSDVRDAISESTASGFLMRAVPGLWLHFSIHLVALAAFGILAMFSLAHGARRLVALLALVVAADAGLVLSLAGFFAGVALLVAAALCFALAAVIPGRRDISAIQGAPADGAASRARH